MRLELFLKLCFQLTFIFSVASNSECVGLKACLDLEMEYFKLTETVYNSISYLGIVKMNHCTIVLDHVDFLNAGDVVDCNARMKLEFRNE